MRKASQHDYDSEAYYLVKAAKMVRRDILKIRNSFDGAFSSTCQNDTLPATLRTLVDMIINNPTAVKESDEQRVPSQACLSISQLLVFSSVATDRTGSVTRHAQVKECPLPIYVAIKFTGQQEVRHWLNLCTRWDYAFLMIDYCLCLLISPTPFALVMSVKE